MAVLALGTTLDMRVSVSGTHWVVAMALEGTINKRRLLLHCEVTAALYVILAYSNVQKSALRDQQVF